MKNRVRPMSLILTGVLVSLTLAGCGGQTTATPSTSDSPTQLVGVFLQAVESKDLSAASQYYAPDKQPGSWKDILGYFVGNWNSATDSYDHVPVDLSGCSNISYNPVVRQVGGYATVNVVFATNCYTALPPLGSDHPQPYNVFGVNMEDTSGRWYVYGVSDQVSSSS